MPRQLMHQAATWVVLLMVSGVVGGADYVWWEGESPVKTNFPSKTWFSASTFEASRHRILSGGDWLTNTGKRKDAEAFASYRIRVSKSGDYALWCRKFWKHGPFRWRFDRRPWQTCTRDVGLASTTPIRKHLCVNWVYLGKVKLDRGTHTFELRLLANEGQNLTACFDAFLLSPTVFTPRGRLKPDEKSGDAEPGWWAFEPATDTFADAMLDLRPLNEKIAGESGFVRRNGDDFVLGNGKPVRFWAVNVGGGVVRLGKEPQKYLARRLAKVGVNMVRVHSALFDRGAPDPAAPDRKYLDSLHHLVAVLRAEGIYVKLSFYFPLWFDVKPTYGIPGYDTIRNKKPFALLYFDARMQAIYKSWARALLTTRNPYTFVPLGKDPAVAIVEIVNEDSTFFWTFAKKNIPRVQMMKLEKRFGDWLRKRYGSLAKAPAAWGARASHKNDEVRKGRVALLSAWHMTSQGVARSGISKKRMSDQLRFLTEHQKGFYADMVRYFRKDLGAKCLVSCSNWKTADARTLDALERYTYTAGDVIDRHGYFGGRHSGEGANYSVRVGHTFADRAGVLEPTKIPIQVNAVKGFPHIISEIGWPNPNRFKAEFPFLAAAYGSLTGIDGIFFFAVGSPGWDHDAKKFPVSCPTIMGQFPALALAYRRGDVREGKTVAHETLKLDDLYAFKGSAAVTPPALDALRKKDVAAPAGAAHASTGVIDPLAFFVGRVTRDFSTTRHSAKIHPLEDGELVDRKKSLIRSRGREVGWDTKRGIVHIMTERTVGVTGFLGKRPRFDIGGVRVESKNHFGSIVVTSLDGESIATSKKLLIQAMTEERPFGWQVKGNRIVNLGGYPMNVRRIDATVTLEGRHSVKTVTVLDAHGYPRTKLKPERTAAGYRIKLPPDAIYTIVEK